MPAGAQAGEPESTLERLVREIQHVWQRVHAAVFQNMAWIPAYFAVLALSAYRLARSRACDEGAFLLFVLTLIPLGASLVVSLIVISADRYSYPTQFICYLGLALTPLLLARKPPTGDTGA